MRKPANCATSGGIPLDSIWLWPLGLVAFLLAWPALRALGVRYLGDRVRSQAMVDPPDHISLARMSEVRWRNPVAREAANRQLEGAGFVEAGLYVVHEMPQLTVALYAHPGESAYGVLYDHPRSGFWVELVSRYQDGTIASYSTLEPLDVDVPTGSSHVSAPELRPGDLWKKMLAERPRKPLRPCSRNHAAADFERGYAESVARHKQTTGELYEDVRKAA
jgi:hypothetical protein